jgi:hypothetical protein
MKPRHASALLRQIADGIDGAERPSKAVIAGELRRVLAGIASPDQKAVEEALYGHSGGNPAEQGSSIWWLVFDEIGMEDWTPLTDFPAVEAEAVRLIAEWSKGWNDSPEGKAKTSARLLASLKGNWEAYRSEYMPEHVRILGEKGLGPAAG